MKTGYGSIEIIGYTGDMRVEVKSQGCVWSTLTLSEAKRVRKLLDTQIAKLERHKSMERIRREAAR